MAQVKVYGHRHHLQRVRGALSDAIHASLIDALELPPDKRFQRFLPLDEGMFDHPADRTDAYTIIEISMFEGRSVEAKKRLIHLLFVRISEIGITPQDLEITIFETPRHNWGIHGQTGDALALSYDVTI